jgi:cellulose synthase/poly-beta-1,6-N-acetylglucosamine synthase-like glycosyltransferase
MISVLIPTYRESDLLETLLNQLIKDPYENKEIITIIDEPTENSLKIVKKYKKHVKFLINKKRKGKVNALNEATKFAKGDIFLFLDSDGIISKGTKNFLKKVVENIRDVDLLDIKKKPFVSSLLSKIINYEYLSFNMGAFLCSKIVKKCVGIWGSAFAIKRNFFEEIGGFKHVIAEDLEIGIQTFLKDKTFKFASDIEIVNRTASSWEDWFKQRERWGVGAGYHIKKYWKTYLKNIFKYPQVSLLSFYLAWPTIISFLSLLLVDSFLGRSLLLLLISLSLRFTFLSPFIFILSLYTIFLRNILLFVTTYIFSALIFYLVSKKFGLHFSNLNFFIFYTLYSPLFSCVYFFHLLRGIFSSEEIVLKDWKV